jgi:hypothetical protein
VAATDGEYLVYELERGVGIRDEGLVGVVRVDEYVEGAGINEIAEHNLYQVHI